MIRGVESNPTELLSKKALKSEEAEGPEGRERRSGATGRAEEDRLSIGSKQADPTYRKPPTGEVAAFDAKLAIMRDLVAKTFEKQGLAFTIQIGNGATANINELSPQDAEALTSEDGYWGAEKTAGRIVDFATRLAGNDPTKLDAIKEGVRKGFSMAERGFGGSLPDISNKTLDTAMSMLDQWAKNAQGSTAEAAPVAG